MNKKTWAATVAAVALTATSNLVFAGELHPAEITLMNYLTAEAGSVSLFEFCKSTRPYVVTPDDYPDCPPHDFVGIINQSKTTYSCNGGLNEFTCNVSYEVVAAGTPFAEKPWSVSVAYAKPEIEHHQFVMRKSDGWKIANPYILPHVSKAALRKALDAAQPSTSSYKLEILRSSQLLRKTAGSAK